MGRAARLVQNSQVVDAKNQSDTLKLWEGYREQATLWRSIALLQLPTTFIMCVFALVMWNTRKITLNVPPKPLPGYYSAHEIPKTEFIDVATNFVNLIATYQPAVARRQFSVAMEMINEPLLTRFRDEMAGTELKAIENTNRTQLFFIDPTRTAFNVQKRNALVTLYGERLKIIAGKQLPTVRTMFELTMTTIPKNKLNPYGIVITNVTTKNVRK